VSLKKEISNNETILKNSDTNDVVLVNFEKPVVSDIILANAPAPGPAPVQNKKNKWFFW
jgi:hypothetical protein